MVSDASIDLKNYSCSSRAIHEKIDKNSTHSICPPILFPRTLSCVPPSYHNVIIFHLLFRNPGPQFMHRRRFKTWSTISYSINSATQYWLLSGSKIFNRPIFWHISLPSSCFHFKFKLACHFSSSELIPWTPRFGWLRRHTPTPWITTTIQLQQDPKSSLPDPTQFHKTSHFMWLFVCVNFLKLARTPTLGH